MIPSQRRGVEAEGLPAYERFRIQVMAASLLVPMVLAMSACMAPGGGVSGRVLTESGQPLPATVEVDFGQGAVIDLRTEEAGQFWTVWSHGSWAGPRVRASAPDRQPAETRIGWDSWKCEFRLARSQASPGASTVTCEEADGTTR